MSFYHTKDVRSTLRLITLISWFVGMGIIEYPVGHRRTVLGLLYSFTLFIFHAICTILANFEGIQVHLKVDAQLVDVMYGAYCGLISVTVGVIIVVSFLCNKKRGRCITELEEINGIMMGIGVVRSYKRFLVSQVLQLGLLVLIIMSIEIPGYFVSIQPKGTADRFLIFCKMFSGHYSFFISTVNETMFCNFIEMITVCFEDLNALLESLRVKHSYDSQNTENNLVQVNGFLKDERKIEILYSIRKIYTRLARVAKDWNQINAAAIVTTVVFSTWILTFQIYIMYILLSLLGIQAVTNIYFFGPFLMVIFFSCRLFMIVRSTVSLTTQAHKTCEIALHLYPITSLRSEVRTFSMQLIQNPLHLTLHGLCSLDYSMIQQVIVTVATYSIMCAQNMGVPNFNTKNQQGPENGEG